MRAMLGLSWGTLLRVTTQDPITHAEAPKTTQTLEDSTFWLKRPRLRGTPETMYYRIFLGSRSKFGVRDGGFSEPWEIFSSFGGGSFKRLGGSCLIDIREV